MELYCFVFVWRGLSSPCPPLPKWWSERWFHENIGIILIDINYLRYCQQNITPNVVFLFHLEIFISF